MKFGKVIRSEEIRLKMRKFPNVFVRIFKFPWFDVLFYLIFRHEKCTQSEISSYYSVINKKDLRISKQAAFKAIHKVNPAVFPLLIRKFAVLFYQSLLVKTHKGYILLAEDGTIYSSDALKGVVVSTVGAGDSMVAGFIAGYLRSSGNYETAFRQGMCAGAASSFSLVIPDARQVDYMMRISHFDISIRR